MTAGTGGIGGLPPSPAVDCDNPAPPVGEEFSLFWSGDDQLRMAAPDGSTAFNDATSYTITLATGETVTIPSNDPHLNVIDGETVEINGLTELFPGVTAPMPGTITVSNGSGQIGGYDGNDGLPSGEYALVQPTPEFLQQLFPGLPADGSHILMGTPGGGCYYASIWYDCANDKLYWGFNARIYGGDVYRTEVVTDDGGSFNSVPVTDEWRTFASAWTYGSGMAIENASSYGINWAELRAYDINDELLCEYIEPQQTWNGGTWDLEQSRCVGGTPTPTTMYITSGESSSPGQVTLHGGLLTTDPLGQVQFVRMIYSDFSGWLDFYLDNPGQGGSISDFTVDYLDDNTIIISSPALSGHEYGAVVITEGGSFSAGGQYDIPPFTVAEPAAPDVTDARPTAPDSSFGLYGTGLSTAGLRWRILDDETFDKTYYTDQPNDPGVTVQVNGEGEVVINDPNMIAAGIAPTLVQTRDAGNNVIDEFYPETFPQLLSICSPSMDSVRFEGLRFQSAGHGPVGYTIPRGVGDIYSGPQTQHEFADGSPDAYGWTLVTFTDTVIELQNPNFQPGDVTTGVAFHDPTANANNDGMYYYEPWGTNTFAAAMGEGCPEQPMIVSATKTGPNEIEMEVTSLDGVETIYFDIDTTQPNTGEGIRYPVSMMTVVGNIVTANFGDFLGNAIESIVLEDAAQNQLHTPFPVNLDFH